MGEEQRRFTRSKWVVTGWTGLSRIGGLIRDILTAAVFGTSSATDAFMVAFALPNLFRNLFGEGAAGIAFVPVFSETCRREGEQAGFRLAETVITLLALVLAAISVLGVGICFFLSETGRGELVLRLSGVMLPYLFFICLVGFLGKLLNCLGRFGAPAALPLVFNVSWITALAVLCPLLGGSLDRQVYGLAAGVLAGGVLQLVLQWGFLLKAGFRFRARLDFSHPGLARIFRKMGPSILAMAVMQINTLADKYLAVIFLPEGSVSSLFYANRLVQFPLGVFGVSLATAALPLLSRLQASGRTREFRETLSHALRSGLLIALPATLGLILLREPLIRLIYQRGEFDVFSTNRTAFVLLWYATGLIFFITVKVATQGFYALKKHEIPAWTGGMAVGVNLVLNLVVVLVPPVRNTLGAGGLALSTSISYLLNSILLLVLLRKHGGLGGGLKPFLLRLLPAGGGFAAACLLTAGALRTGVASAGIGSALLAVFAPGLAGLAVFLLILRLLGVPLRDYLPARRSRD